MGFRIKISDKLNRKTKKWNSIVLVDFFISRQGIYLKEFLTNATRLIQGYTMDKAVLDKPSL